MKLIQKATTLSNTTDQKTAFPDVFIDPLMTEPTSGAMSRSNQKLKYLLLTILFLSPIPLGSNRPVFWATWAVVVTAIAIWYSMTLLAKNAEPRVKLSDVRAPFWLLVLLISYTLFQCLPIGRFLEPFEFSSLNGATILSNSLSLTPGDTWLAALRWVTYGAFFFLILQVGSRSERARSMFKVLIIITALQAIYALIALTQLGDLVLFLPKEQYEGNATGTFINRNSLATYLSLGAVLAFSLLVRPTTRKRKSNRHFAMQAYINERLQKLWILIVFIFIIVALIATQSRMGVMSGFAGLFVVMLLRVSQMAHVRFIFFAIPALLVPLGFMFGSGLADRFIDSSISIERRFNIYEQVLNMLRERPLLGYGADSFNHAFPLFHDFGVSTALVWDKAHSTYLSNWVELGLIVGSVPILILMLLVWPLAKQLFSKDRIRTETIAAIGATVTISTHSLFDFSMEMQAIVLTYLAILGLALGTHLGAKQVRSTSARFADRKSSQKKPVVGASERKPRNSETVHRSRLYFNELPDVVYAIGDVHGRFDLLQTIESKIVEDAKQFPGEKWIILLGDFVDRGPQSAQVIEHLLKKPPAGFKRYAIAGNHEVMMQAFLAGVPKASSWVGFGGNETLRSYGLSEQEISQVLSGGKPAEYLLSSHIPDEHREFLAQLPDSVVTPSHIFVHIGMNESQSIANEVELAARLTRDQEVSVSDEILIIHGHRVVPEPVRYGSQVNIDTGAYETGRLTAVRILRETGLHFLDSHTSDR